MNNHFNMNKYKDTTKLFYRIQTYSYYKQHEKTIKNKINQYIILINRKLYTIN